MSPANLGGKRAGLVLNPRAQFGLARQLHSPGGVPLGELSSFVSGLYFRGKMTYAQAFGRGPEGLPGALVISPSEGLRFLHERVTIDRLVAWSKVPIDERNPSYTEPLIAHATALEQSLGARARFVLLGSVASDKYVKPLLGVFGDRLLFPSEFIGRGDMSRGALLLRAARAGRELEYAPIRGAVRRGPRARRIAALAVQAPKAFDGLELVILVGLPGSGKTTFFRQRFERTHVHVSKDVLRAEGRSTRLQSELVRQGLSARRSLVIDNTNASVEERASLIAEARRNGARVVGYYFSAGVRSSIARNRQRQGRAKVPNVGIYATARRLVEPGRAEGFDELYTVDTLGDLRFEVAPTSELVDESG